MDLFLQLFPRAQAAVDANAFGAVINPIIANIVNPAVELLVSVGIVVFIWGIVDMMIHGDSTEARENGRKRMMGGIIGVFIMLAAWGIIYLIANTVGSIAAGN